MGPASEGLASMGLRDWVSEKGGARRRCRPRWPGFNGAPRLGLGEGTRATASMCAARAMRALQWGSETGSRRRKQSECCGFDQVQSLQWGSETGSRRRAGHPCRRSWGRCGFNGAPRLGLGEGGLSTQTDAVALLLQWGSETGSRRRLPVDGRREGAGRASMGLRDWVSEKATKRPVASRRPRPLQWGSETGSRRRSHM